MRPLHHRAHGPVREISTRGAIAGAFQVPPHHWAYDVPRPVVALGYEMTLTEVEETRVHCHHKAQLILALKGLVTCQVDNSVWLVPPDCAVWIPGGLSHSLKAIGDVRICCLFIEPESAALLPADCCTIGVSPLLRELLLQAVSFPELYDLDGADGRVAAVLLDQLAASPRETFHVPMPGDPRLRRIADAILADPSDRLTIAQWGRRVGASERTLARILHVETGMSFGRWRQQLQILIALRRLVEGTPVQTVATDLGYESASAFITMFRKALGMPPARYLADRRSRTRHEFTSGRGGH